MYLHFDKTFTKFIKKQFMEDIKRYLLLNRTQEMQKYRKILKY